MALAAVRGLVADDPRRVADPWQWAIGSMQLWGMNGEMPTATAGTLLALLAAVDVVGFVAALVASIPEPSYG